MTTERTRSTTVPAPAFPAPRPAGDDDRWAARTADRVLALHRILAATDLRPGEAVDAAFGELVAHCLHAPAGRAAAVLDRLAGHVDAVRALAGIGEARLEEHWSARITGARDPRAELERFPYLGNYHDLVRLELAALDAAGGPRPGRVVVLGSGPLPLTGLVLASHGASVLHVDRDRAAVAAGAAVAAATGTGAGVRSLVADLEAPRWEAALTTELRHADVVLLGALVGGDAAAKATLLGRLAATVRRDTRLLVRSAAGLRTLLYPPVPADLPGCEVLVEVHPHTDVVNSVLVARPAG